MSRLGVGWSAVLSVLALAVTYFVAALLGFLAAPVHNAVSAAWPPAGIALAALVLFGRRLWPGIVLGALSANLVAGVSAAGAVVIAAGNTLEALVGLWILQRAGFRPSMDRLRDVLVLSATTIAATVPAALIGILVLYFEGADPYGGLALLWLNWWTGDAIGIIIVAPLVLTAISVRWARPRHAMLEPTALLLGLFVLTVFFVQTPYPYPLFPAAIFAAYRLGPRGAAMACAIIAATAVFFTVQGLGPFVLRGASPATNLFIFQAFVALLSVSALASAAVLAEQRSAQADLRESEAHLVEAQAMARLGSWRWDVENDRIEWSDELYRIYGLDRGTSPATVQNYLDRVHPEDRARVETSIRDALKERRAFQLDERIVRPDGTVRVLETRGKVLDHAGRGLTMAGVCQDVTDARYAQQLLLASEAKFAAMFRASPVAICVIALDNNELIDANARFYEMLGNAPTGSVIGVSPRELGMWTEPGEMRDLVARLRKTRSVREIPVRFLTRDGLERRALAALELMEINGRECAVTLFWRP